jgi:proteasome component ECM29
LGFKVLDDIKESVRVAAMGLCRVLTAILVRSVESSSSSSSKDTNVMLENVMPFLLSTSGLEASAQEVQMFALGELEFLVFTYEFGCSFSTDNNFRHGIEAH